MRGDRFWEFISRSMSQCLQDVGSTLNVVQRSWDDISERHSNLDLGRKMSTLAPIP